jgi:hypothetical protein
MTITGTSHFVSIDAAAEYYKDYHYTSTRAAVLRKIHDGEIHIGKPATKRGEHVQLIDNGLRYAIVSDK